MGKREILVFINSEVGGAERMSVLISKMLIRAGMGVKFVIIKKKENAASITDFLPKGYDVINVDARNHIERIKQMYNAIRDSKVDVVFSSHYNINDKILILKPFFRKVKFVIRSDNYYYTFSHFEKLIIQLTYRWADTMIAQTREMKEEFVRHRVISDHKVYALENPVDKENVEAKIAQATSPYPDDGKKHIVAVGRFAFQKGYDYLIDAFAQLLKRHPDCHLYIVGAYTEKWKDEYDKIQNIINKLGVKSYVHCVGYQDNPYRYVKYADLFVLSSRWEGLPNVLAEALYLQKPIAAFKCVPVIERMVRDGLDGYLAEREDTCSLTEAMVKALKLGATNPVYKGSEEECFVRLFE